MDGKVVVIMCAWFLVYRSCLGGNFIIEKNSLKVASPKSIKGAYDSAIGDYGIPEHGGSLFGSVFYVKANPKACKSFHKFGVSFKSKRGTLPSIVLVDRGDCYWVMKAWNVQINGGAVVLIADDRDEQLNHFYTSNYGNYEQNITIPSIFISKTLGNMIKYALHSGQIVNIMLSLT